MNEPFMRPAGVYALLADGRTVQIRPAAAGDFAAVKAMHEEMSPDNSYLRFFSLSRTAAEREARRVTREPSLDHAALLAVYGGQVAGLASYEVERDSGGKTAEVAFAVADTMHQRGIAMLLLEHLVSLARARQVETFVAETLSENIGMLRVFSDAGLPVTSRREDGVVTVTIPLPPDDDGLQFDAYLDTVAARERAANVASLRPVFQPASVAVIGASRRPGTVGRSVLENIKSGGYAGRLYAVNPNAQEIAGVPCFPDVASLPEAPDLALLAVPPEEVIDAADACGRLGVRGLVVFAAAVDAAAGAALLAVCRRYGMRLIGPNCFGIAVPSIGLDATFAAANPAPGTAGLVMQSGGLGFALVDHLTRLGIGISSFASVGNKLDVSSNDMLMWWERDGQTRVAVLYIESFGNPRKFARTARRVGARIPVITVHAGRSEAGQRAAATHTSSTATPLVTREALFEQAGIIATPSFGELMGATALLATQPPPAGRTVAIVSNVGGAGVLAADACTDLGLTVHHPHGETSSGWPRSSPTAAPSAGRWTRSRRSRPTTSARRSRCSRPTRRCTRSSRWCCAPARPATCSRPSRTPISACRWRWWCSTSRRPSARSTPGAARSPPTPTRRRPPGRSPAPPGTRSGAARRAPRRPTWPTLTPSGGASSCTPSWPPARRRLAAASEVDALLGHYGFSLAPAAAARAGEDQVAIGVKDDQMFGPLVMLGPAGPATDPPAGHAVRLAPLTSDDADMLINSIRSGPLPPSRRARARPGTATAAADAALHDALLRVSRLTDDLPEVAELDLNPVIARPEGAVVVDARVRVAPELPQDPFLRKLRLKQPRHSRPHVGRDRERQQAGLARGGVGPRAGHGQDRDGGGGEGGRRVGRRVGQPRGELRHARVVPDQERGPPLGRELADQHQQAEHGRVVHPGFVADRRGGAGHRRAQPGRGKFPGLARPQRRRADHRVRRVPGLAEPAADRGRVPPAALGQRAVLVGDIGPVRLGVPEQDQPPTAARDRVVDRRAVAHGTTVTGHLPARTRRTASDPSSRWPALSEAPTTMASARVSCAMREIS